jgi:hypothetical protein
LSIKPQLTSFAGSGNSSFVWAKTCTLLFFFD